MSTRPALTTFLRDIGSWVIGCLLMLKQAGIFFPPPAEVNETLVWVAAIFVGGPGILTILSAVRLSTTPGGTGGDSSPSQSPLPGSPGSSSGGSSEVEPA